MKTTDPIIKAFRRKIPPPVLAYQDLAQMAREALESEAPDIRPTDRRGLPGGLVRLDPELPVIIVPDLHARRGFVKSLLELELDEGFSMRNALDEGQMQILCLGDGFHSESRARDRWNQAYKEFLYNWEDHTAMDMEMTESLGLMEMIMQAKLKWPGHFHFLKGNHENVLNEEGNGNHAFRKFVMEGAMVYSWLERFYGLSFLESYAAMEKALPLFAIGGRFLASHAEPARPYSEEEIINASLDSDTVLGLTWTDNNSAEPGSVAGLLSRFLPHVEKPVYFTGHRTIKNYYRSRLDGLHLQIHNPDKQIIAWIKPERDVNPDMDIGEITETKKSRGSR